MPTFQGTSHGLPTYEAAVKIEGNAIKQISYTHAIDKLREYLWNERETIAALTKHHLGLQDRDVCTISRLAKWTNGSFNICIPVEIKSGSLSKQILFRVPQQHKLGEIEYPGSVEEKLRDEIGAITYLQDECFKDKLTHLYGFGVSGGGHFTHVKHRPVYIRVTQYIWRKLYRLFRPSTHLTQYTIHPTDLSSIPDYEIFEYVEPEMGQMLSVTWSQGRHDPARRQRLFRGIADIILSLARNPQPRIGSYRFNNDCTITLTSRPLSCKVMILENDGASQIIPRSKTYTHTEPFVSDMLTLHDSHFLKNPNAVYDEKDCYGQMAVSSILRLVAHQYIKPEHSEGPFLLQLDDLHQSNIFVDKDWNIKKIIDLEWTCSRPAEMLTVPYWIADCGIDEIKGDSLHEFDMLRQEFMRIFEEQERKLVKEHNIHISKLMDEMWETKGMWFWYCIKSVNAQLYIVEDHICPGFSALLSGKSEEILSKFFCKSATAAARRKAADHQEYLESLRQLLGVEETVVEVALDTR